MKSKIFFSVLLLLIVFPLISSASINTKSNYDSGETIIASISGTFLDAITKDNIYFYRGYTRTSFDFDVAQIGDVYYIYVQTENKAENNYSVQIKGVRYVEGSKVFSDPIIKYFYLNSDLADFSVEPGFIITDGDFYIHLKNLKNSYTDVNIEGITSVKLKPYEIKKIDIVLNVSKTTIKTIKISSSNLNYNFLAYVIKSKKTSTEDNETKTPDEEEPNPDETSGSECITNWNCIGSQTCENGFCVGGNEESNNSPPEENDTTTNTSNETQKGDECIISWNCKSGEYCSNGYCLLKNQTEEPECTVNDDCASNEFCDENGVCKIQNFICGNNMIELDEQCDGTDLDGKKCSLFNFDWQGKLSCDNSCNFNTSKCSEIPECIKDSDCSDDEICSDNGVCIDPNNPPVCGNGIKEAGEDCDKSDLDSRTCPNLLGENWQGDLACNKFCDFDTADCSKTLKSIKTCEELQGNTCGSSEICDEKYIDSKFGPCCIGSCVKKETSKSTKTVGWILIGVIGLFLIFFLSKFRKTKTRKVDFDKYKRR